ncbi:MAG: hypothetical protein Q7T55_00885 [Solirubrobacteraceae bacterium]|nr:hypothetical protein [Solirubrobacteraceae bacterium]
MRHLDANALAQLIGSMAEVASSVAAPAPLAEGEVPAPVAAAIGAFDAGWRPSGSTVASELAARADRLAAAGMAFIEGDPMTAGQLLAEPSEAAPAPAGTGILRPMAALTDRIAELDGVGRAAEQVASDLTGRRLARRAFSDADRSIAGFRAVAAGHRAAADALQTYVAVADAAAGRRRLVEELLDGTPQAGPHTGERAAHLARLRDKASTVDDEAAASIDRCAASIRAAIPVAADLTEAYRGVEIALDGAREMLAEAAAAERAGIGPAAVPTTRSNARDAA